MKTPFTVISFYCGDKFYYERAGVIKKELERCGVDHLVEELNPSESGWSEICKLKPRFILEKLTQLDRPVVWIDVDANVHGDVCKLVEAAYGSDVACAEPDIVGVVSVASHFVFINNTAGGIGFAREWAESTEKCVIASTDHLLLDVVWKKTSCLKTLIPMGELSKQISIGLSDSESKSEDMKKMECERSINHDWRNKIFTS